MSLATSTDSPLRDRFGGLADAYTNGSTVGPSNEPERDGVKEATLTTFADLFCGIGGGGPCRC